ncbi:conserved hypothetical protein [Desulfamplus magnetovallimortis]|uniref:Uncharacterized protein n=1 Tax=Desulfamplus magnetovallimortis TaxID=1246637 RepID=A0A1W1H948_9BACT|nr:hypothetical protein [Desulfamplus magnetovallimortis]SLM29001.1 conserved hypothetical protein [Desulfamplus magnetovallimortis]
MTKKKIVSQNPKTDPERQMAFESLPPHIKNSMDETEKELFLHAEEWPESMFKKLEEFIVSRE